MAYNFDQAISERGSSTFSPQPPRQCLVPTCHLLVPPVVIQTCKKNRRTCTCPFNESLSHDGLLRQQYRIFIRDPRSRIPDLTISIPDPGLTWSRIRTKEFKYFYPKNCFQVFKNKILALDISPFRIPDPGVNELPDPGSTTLPNTYLAFFTILL